MSTEDRIKRDRWGRPLITPPDGGEPVPYTRVSTMCKTLEDPIFLQLWEGRMTAVGLARSPELVDRTVALINKHDRPVDDARKDLNQIVKAAKSAAGNRKDADVGTALHGLAEVLDLGQRLDIVPERWTKHLEVYQQSKRTLDMLDCEVFVVNHHLKVAGTLDRLIRLPDNRVVVGDLKTGKSDPAFPLGVATQVAAYANSERYNPDTGECTPIHPELDLEWGLLLHWPAQTNPPVVNAYELNLTAGWASAVMSMEVRKLRAMDAGEWARPYTLEGDLEGVLIND